ncbi:MAG: hypothetical protein JWR88_1038 [Pseudonocardia sp.]|nr:hypothetical protein [Pseudonocardia sp.]
MTHGAERVNNIPAPLWHGGIPGLRPGDLLVGGQQRRAHPGCPTCEARARGEAGPLEPATAHRDRVYMTGHRIYARFYASLYGLGDLYRVEPIGQPERSDEDHLEAWHAPQARVLAVAERAVRLTDKDRRRVLREWAAADLVAAATIGAQWNERLRQRREGIHV